MAPMTQEAWLDILRCPQTKEPLTPLSKTRLQKLNAAIAQGRAHRATGDPVTEPVRSAMLHPPSMRVYPCHGSVLLLHKDDAIDGTSLF